MIEIIPKHNKINASIIVPGSKSYTNRALLLASLANGKSKITNILESDDTKVMLKALKQLGIKISKEKNSYIVIGNGGKFKKTNSTLHLGNAGTAVRFLTAALTIAPFKVKLTGDERMKQRPIQDLITCLIELGANVKSKNGCPPVIINSKVSQGLVGGITKVSGKNSSQYLSALLMIAPYAKKKVQLELNGELTSLPYVEMTLETMNKFGVRIPNNSYKKFVIDPNKYKSTRYSVEADASSASYAMAIAAINQGQITIKNLSEKSKQADIKFINILKKMGCKLNLSNNKIKIIGPKKLNPLGTINLNHMPDAAMTVAILAAFAKGKSTLKGLANLRIKESDRLNALTTELKKIGVKVKEGGDFLEIDGNPENLNGAIIETYNDHRMAMCFAVIGSKIPGINILNPTCVNKTYPDFWKDLYKIGIKQKKHTPNIVFAGLRGTGKSTIGKALAKKIKYKFIDTDSVIEKKLGKKIPEIIATKGWDFFRNEEALIAKKLSKLSKTVISTGGGFLVNSKNANMLKQKGLIIILKCDPSVSAERCTNSYTRPALTNQKDMRKEMEQMWNDRKNKYLEIADIIFDTNENSSIQSKTKKIMSILKNKDVIK